SLDQKKFRKEHQLFVAEGAKIAQEILQSSLKVTNLYASESWLSTNSVLYKSLDPNVVYEVGDREMKQISFLSTPSPVLLLVQIPEPEPYIPLTKNALSLGLEAIRDPGNLGTIIRLADWYGLEQVFCSEDCVDVYNPKTVQATMGSIARVKIHYLDLSALLDENKVDSYAATPTGETNIHTLEAKPPGILLIGNESAGLSEALLAKATYGVKIPRFGEAESLNAAIATGILLDNFKRIFG
ncbi:MAG: TrmH family RNA methyltransferase, partial [Bacteroidia bacterium]